MHLYVKVEQYLYASHFYSSSTCTQFPILLRLKTYIRNLFIKCTSRTCFRNAFILPIKSHNHIIEWTICTNWRGKIVAVLQCKLFGKREGGGSRDINVIYVSGGRDSWSEVFLVTPINTCIQTKGEWILHIHSKAQHTKLGLFTSMCYGLEDGGHWGHI